MTRANSTLAGVELAKVASAEDGPEARASVAELVDLRRAGWGTPVANDRAPMADLNWADLV